LIEQKLAAASSACGMVRLGATTGPLNGRALTRGVDTRTGEGAGSSAATLHRVTMDGFSSPVLAFFDVLVEE
jgi:hypothetical protein